MTKSNFEWTEDEHGNFFTKWGDIEIHVSYLKFGNSGYWCCYVPFFDALKNEFHNAGAARHYAQKTCERIQAAINGNLKQYEIDHEIW